MKHVFKKENIVLFSLIMFVGILLLFAPVHKIINIDNRIDVANKIMECSLPNRWEIITDGTVYTFRDTSDYMNNYTNRIHHKTYGEACVNAQIMFEHYEKNYVKFYYVKKHNSANKNWKVFKKEK